MAHHYCQEANGSFQINVSALGSGVNIKYHAVVTNENLPRSMVFYMQETESTRYEGLTELIGDTVVGELLTNGVQSKTYTVCWEWPEDGNDTVDSSTDMNYGFNLEVIGEQI